MRAVVYEGDHDVSIEEVEDARTEKPTDALRAFADITEDHIPHR